MMNCRYFKLLKKAAQQLLLIAIAAYMVGEN